MHILRYILLVVSLLLAQPADAENFNAYGDSPFKICNNLESIKDLYTASLSENYTAAEIGVRAILRLPGCVEKTDIVSIPNATVLYTKKVDFGMGYNAIVFIKLTSCNTFDTCYMSVARNFYGSYEDLTHAILVVRRTSGIFDWLKK